MPEKTLDHSDIDLWRQFEQVRLTGETNMFDRPAVQAIAAEIGLWTLEKVSATKYAWLLANYSALQAAAAKEDQQTG